MALTVKQSITGSSAGSFVASLATSNFGSSVTTGSTIVLFVMTSAANSDVSSVTDTQSNTYIRYGATYDSSALQSIEVWVARNVTGGASFHITATDSNFNLTAVMAYEIGGLPATGYILDRMMVTTGVSGTLASTLGTTVNAHDILLQAGTISANTGTWTVDTNYTNLISTASVNAFAAQVRIVSTTGTYTGTLTESTTGQDFGTIQIALSDTDLTGNGNIYRLFAQDARGTSSTTSVSATYPATATATHLLVASVYANVASSSIAISGWTVAKAQDFSSGTTTGVAILYKLSAGTETSISATATGASAMRLHIYEYMGNANPIALDGTGGTTSGATAVTSLAGASITTATSNDLLFTSYAMIAAMTEQSIDSGYVIQQVDAATQLLFDGDQMLITTGSYGSTGSWNASASSKASNATVAFKAAGSSFPGSKTQTATARVSKGLTKTQPAVGRIQNSVTKTQSAVARITEQITKLQTAVARMAKALTKAQSAIARIAIGGTKTQTGVARISNATLTKTQSALARISNTAVTKTQAATARVSKGFTKTQGAIARIAQSFAKTQTAVSRIQATPAKTQTATARVNNTGVAKTQSAVARITEQTTKNQTAVGRIQKALTKTQSAIANIVTGTVITKTQGAVGRMTKALTFTQPALARVSKALTKTQAAVARVQRSFSLTQSAKGRLQTSRSGGQQFGSFTTSGGNGQISPTQQVGSASSNVQVSYSFKFKINTPEVTTNRQMFSLGTNRLDCNLEATTNKFFVWFTDSTNTGHLVWRSTQSYADGQTHRVVVNKTATSIDVYFDSNPIPVGSFATTDHTHGDTGVFNIGNALIEMGEVSVWGRSLTAPEIAGVWQGTFPSSGQLLQWMLNDGYGTVIADSSGSGLNGVLGTNQTFANDSQVAVARLRNTVTKTQPAVARVSKSFSFTQPAVARVVVVGTETQGAIARISNIGYQSNLVANGFFNTIPTLIAPQTTNLKWVDGTAAGSSTNTYHWFGRGTSGGNSVSFDTTNQRGTNVNSINLHCGLSTSAIEISNDVGNTYNTPPGQGFVLKPSTKYLLSGWVKTANMTGDSNNGAGFSLLTADATGNDIGGVSTTYTKTNIGWTYFSATHTTASNIAAGHVELRFYGHTGAATLQGDAYFSEVEVREVGTNQPATARITEQITTNTTAKGRIQKIVTKLQTALANIQHVFSTDQIGTSFSSELPETFTQTAKARVRNTNVTLTQGAKATIVRHVTKTQTATARIVTAAPTKPLTLVPKPTEVLLVVESETITLYEDGTTITLS